VHWFVPQVGLEDRCVNMSSVGDREGIFAPTATATATILLNQQKSYAQLRQNI
jgi:hypothetical protein